MVLIRFYYYSMYQKQHQFYILFLVYLYLHKGELKGKGPTLFLRWAFSSLFAGLLGAPMWLPALKAYSGGGRLQLRPDYFACADKDPRKNE